MTSGFLFFFLYLFESKKWRFPISVTSSNVHSRHPPAIKNVKLTGPEDPLQTQSATYTCDVTLSAADTANGTAVESYAWFKDGVNQNQTTQSFLLTPPAGGNGDGRYSCQATIGSTTASSNFLNVTSIGEKSDPFARTCIGYIPGVFYLMSRFLSLAISIQIKVLNAVFCNV